MFEARRGSRGRGPLAVRWDRREDFAGELEDELGELGEDTEGVWTKRHPEAVLMEEPEVAELMAEFWRVSERGITTEHYATRSAWWVTGWGIALAARQRKDFPKPKPKKPEVRRGAEKADNQRGSRAQRQARS